MSESPHLMATVEQHEESLTQLAEAAQQRDWTAFQAGVVSLLGGMVTSVPLVGSLLAIGYKEVVARTMYARSTALVAESQAESKEDERVHAVARAVVDVLGPALEAVSDGVAGVEARLAALEARWTKERSRAGEVRVHQDTVEAGVGTHVKTGFDKDVHIEQQSVRGGTGVVLGD